MKKSIAAAVLFVLAAILLIKLAGAQERFDHAKHARLFPLCISCHEGIETGVRADVFPPAESCAQCHNGTVERKVEWSGPTHKAHNLKFKHAEHFAKAGSSECADCHERSPGTSRMQVVFAQAEVCIACHRKDEPGAGPVLHFAQDNDCMQCHKPLRDARNLSTARIAAFPQPATHEAADFIRTHGLSDASAAGTCAVCHTQESCSRCHANAGDIPLIAALGSNEMVAGVVAQKKAVYPEPDDHDRADFAQLHGRLAESDVARCANCHTRESCQQCHGDGRAGADQIAKLPRRGIAPGVVLARHSVHPVNFAQAHGVSAGASSESCTSCHSEKFCSDCHQGEGRFHPANFASRHAVAVYAGETDCASCHSREVFCQECHNSLGMTATGGRNTPFHTGQTVWLLQHGQPARQNLESCTSCHTQSSCARCHSTRGGWGVNPHGSVIPRGRQADKNQVTCLRCHYSGTFK